MSDVQSGKNKNLAKGLGIKDEDWKNRVANNFVIDVNKRAVIDKVNKKEPRFTE